MPIDIQSSPVLSLTDATKALPPVGGKRLHPSTLWRWCKVGIRGVRLEYARLGHRIVTTEDAIARFAQRLAEADETTAGPKLATEPKPRTPARRQKDIARAEAELARAGM